MGRGSPDAHDRAHFGKVRAWRRARAGLLEALRGRGVPLRLREIQLSLEKRGGRQVLATYVRMSYRNHGRERRRLARWRRESDGHWGGLELVMRERQGRRARLGALIGEADGHSEESASPWEGRELPPSPRPPSPICNGALSNRELHICQRPPVSSAKSLVALRDLLAARQTVS